MEEVKLKNKQKFIDILADYHISEHALSVLKKVNYVVLIGPAAAGRNTIINYLVEHNNYQFIVSDTTRPRKVRDSQLEKDGVNYFFRSEEGFLDDLRNGEFLEAELIHGQQVSGTSIRELEKAAQTGQIAINEIEFGGAMNVLSAKDDTIVIAIMPPSFEVWQQRIGSREITSKVEFQNRILTARKVIDTMAKEDRVRVVINHEFHEAAYHVDQLVRRVPQTEEYLEEAEKTVKEFSRKIDELILSF